MSRVQFHQQCPFFNRNSFVQVAPLGHQVSCARCQAQFLANGDQVVGDSIRMGEESLLDRADKLIAQADKVLAQFDRFLTTTRSR